MEVERVVIVGGGVLGTMHALEARRRGHEVVQLEREAEARGASVRNFGLVWVSGRAAGAELELALRARELWAQIAVRVPGIGFRAAARSRWPPARPSWACSRRRRRCPTRARGYRAARRRRTSARSTRPCAASSPAGCCAAPDAIVEPRQVLARAARATWRPARPATTWLPGREVAEVAPQRGPRPHRRLAPVRPGGPVPRRGAHRGGRAVPGRRGGRGAAGPAADDADRAAGRAAHHGAGRRRLAALLPRLRPARPAASCRRRPRRRRGRGRSCCWSSGPTAG